MAESKADRALKAWDQHMSIQRQWHAVWQDLTSLIHPRRSGTVLQLPRGTQQTLSLFDSTAVFSNTVLAASMQGALTSAATQWFGFALRGLDRTHPLAYDIYRWLDVASSVAHDELHKGSNFASEASELYGDLGAIGIGAIFEDVRTPKAYERFSGLRFTTFAPAQYVVAEDAEGRINEIYMKHRMSAKAALAKWPETATDEIRRAAGSTQDSEPWVIVHGVYPRETYDNRAYQRTRSARAMPYASCWVLERGRKLLAEGGYNEFPAHVPRWSTVSGDIYGRGPGDVALPDVKTLNTAVRLKLAALSKAIEPPIKVRDDGVIGNVRLTPGGLTYVRDMDAVQVLDLGGRFDVADMEEEKLRVNIRRMFFTDQLQLQEGPQMTAYEVQVRYELMQRILGPTLGRLETEFLDPLINRTFWILMRADRFPPMPPALQQWLAEGHPLDIVYEGPLARAARLSEVVATQRFLQVIGPVAEFQPSVLDNVNFDELVRAAASAVGLKPALLNPPDQVAQTRQIRQAQEQQQQQQAQMAQMADSAGKAAPALKALMEAQAGGILPAGGQVVAPPVQPS